MQRSFHYTLQYRENVRTRAVRFLCYAAALLVAAMVLVDSPAYCADPPAGAKGWKFYARCQLQNGADVLPPGQGELNFITIVDTGSGFTTVARGAAQAFGLLKNDETDNGFADGEVELGGIGGGEIKMHVSKALKFWGAGLKQRWAPYDRGYVAEPDRRVVYPKKNEKDILSLLGTNVLGMLNVKWYPDGSISLDPQLDPRPRGANFVVPLVPEDVPEPPTDDFVARRIIPSVVLNDAVEADFVLATGCPYVILSQSTANLLNLQIDGTFDIWQEDPETFYQMFQNGFFDDEDPGPFSYVSLDTIKLPTIDGSGVSFAGQVVFINPFPTDKNVLGTPCLLMGDTATVLSMEDNTLQYGLEVALPVPALTSWGAVCLIVFVLLAGCWLFSKGRL